jgi:hypothetical protein
MKKDTSVQAGASEEIGFTAAEYNHVATTSRLEAIKLLKLDFDVRPERFEVDGDIRLSFGRKPLSCRFDEASSAAAAIFQFSVTARQGRSRALHLVADYAVLYAIASDATPEAATAFSKHVGGFASYPYFRALAAQMAWNAGVDLPPLPAIAAMPIVPKAKSEIAEDKGVGAGADEGRSKAK